MWTKIFACWVVFFGGGGYKLKINLLTLCLEKFWGKKPTGWGKVKSLTLHPDWLPGPLPCLGFGGGFFFDTKPLCKSLIWLALSVFLSEHLCSGLAAMKTSLFGSNTSSYSPSGNALPRCRPWGWPDTLEERPCWPEAERVLPSCR